MSFVDDVNALKLSSAGMRLIALLTLYNKEDDVRLYQLIADSYHPDLLALGDVNARLSGMNRLREQVGKLRVRQTIGVSKEHVIVLLEGQREGEVLVELRVGEDYPHSIIDISLTPIKVNNSSG